MEWPNEVIFEFLKLYKVEPTLWNTRSPEHKNQKDLYDAWYRIKSKLTDGNITIKEIKKKRDNLMATYRKMRSKVIDSKMAGKTGSHAYKPDWPFYKEMSKFLDDIYTPRKIKNAKGNLQVTSGPRRKSTLEKKEGVNTTAEPVSTEEDDCAAFCTNLKVQMRFLEVQQKYICQKLISDAIFLARTCQLNLTSRIHTVVGPSDSIPSTSSSSFQIELVPDSSTLRNERSPIPSKVQRTEVPATQQGYSSDDPLHDSNSEEGNPQDSDSEDTKEGIIDLERFAKSRS